MNTSQTRVLHYYEPNTSWTDENGAKTWKIWTKQDWRAYMWLTIDLMDWLSEFYIWQPTTNWSIDALDYFTSRDE
jgi:hypothetical protein